MENGERICSDAVVLHVVVIVVVVIVIVTTLTATCFAARTFRFHIRTTLSLYTDTCACQCSLHAAPRQVSFTGSAVTSKTVSSLSPPTLTKCLPETFVLVLHSQVSHVF